MALSSLTLARTFSSHLAFLHVRPDVRQEFAALAAAEVGAVRGIGDTMERGTGSRPAGA